MRASAVLMLAVAMAVSAFGEEEMAVKSTIRSVQLYKNGLAVIHHSVPIGGAGVYRVEDFAEPVHGTLSVRSESPVSLKETLRMVEQAAGSSAGYEDALAGREVTVYLREPNSAPIKGTVADVAKRRGNERWSRSYQQPSPYSGYWGGGFMGTSAPLMGGRPLVLKTKTGLEMIDASQIARISAEGAATVRSERPVLLLEVRDDAKAAGEVEITYLAKGLSWAPSYRVDVLDEKTLSVEQSAVVKNEMGDLSKVEFELISGFPGVRFAHVSSPLSLSQNWANFFMQLNQPLVSMAAIASNSVVSQQRAGNGDEGTPVLAMEGTDVHYQAAGKHTLAEGESMQLAVASGKAEYERMVEWTVRDARDGEGRLHESWQGQDDDSTDPWDSLRFANPLKFPMTTGPASVFIGGNLAGQQVSNWVDPGARATVRITKAMSIRTQSSEQEQPGERTMIWMGGRQYRQTTVKGQVTVANHRSKAAKMLIHRQFSGEMISADGNPTAKLRADGVWSVNPRNELTWQIQVESGEERKLTYSYSVLVSN